MPEAIAIEEVQKWHNALLDNQQVIDLLAQRRGVTMETIRRYMLGWDAEQKRLWIPVQDSDGAVVNVRLYDVFKNHTVKYYNYGKAGDGYGAAQAKAAPLYPMSTLSSATELYLVEGEGDCLAALSVGLPAVTSGSASMNPERYVHLVRQAKAVYVIMDPDEAGDRAADKISASFTKAGIPHKILNLRDLGSKDGADLTDMLIAGTLTAQTLRTHAERSSFSRHTGDQVNQGPVVAPAITAYLQSRDIEIEKTTKNGEELWFVCPFHKDQNPSCSFNIRTGLWCCLGCGAKGKGTLEFEQTLFGLSEFEARKKLGLLSESPFYEAMTLTSGDKLVCCSGVIYSMDPATRRIPGTTGAACVGTQNKCDACPASSPMSIIGYKKPRLFFRFFERVDDEYEKLLQKWHGIKCKGYLPTVTAWQMYRAVRVGPDVFSEVTAQQAYGADIKGLMPEKFIGLYGKPITFMAYVTAHPQTQEAVFVIIHVEERSKTNVAWTCEPDFEAKTGDLDE